VYTFTSSRDPPLPRVNYSLITSKVIRQGFTTRPFAGSRCKQAAHYATEAHGTRSPRLEDSEYRTLNQGTNTVSVAAQPTERGPDNQSSQSPFWLEAVRTVPVSPLHKESLRRADTDTPDHTGQPSSTRSPFHHHVAQMQTLHRTSPRRANLTPKGHNLIRLSPEGKFIFVEYH
jgi:hypothetical protein